MHVFTHFFTGWALTLPFDLEVRDRRLLVFASVAPDIDGLVVIADLVQGKALDSCDLYATYHHLLCHNILFAVLASLLCAIFARRKVFTGLFALLVIHVHFLADITGSAGPDGSHWEIPYLVPFSTSWNLAVSWQWALNAWPNILLTIGLIMLSLYFAWSRGFSPIALFTQRGDKALVATLRDRFGHPRSEFAA